jgi:hypothetical protein
MNSKRYLGPGGTVKRAMRKNQGMRESALMMSSTNPSTKYSMPGIA